jgi:hypothetical protein
MREESVDSVVPHELRLLRASVRSGQFQRERMKLLSMATAYKAKYEGTAFVYGGCRCKKNCNGNCGCRKKKIPCGESCTCRGGCSNKLNL